MSGSNVRSILSDGRTRTLPPLKNRSGPQVLPLRPTKVLVEPAIIRSSPLGAESEPAEAGPEGDLASTVIGFTACARHNTNAEIRSRAAAPPAIQGPFNQRGRAGAGASNDAGASASTTSETGASNAD